MVKYCSKIKSHLENKFSVSTQELQIRIETDETHTGGFK